MTCVNHHSGCECYDKEFSQTKSEVASLRAEIKRLRDGYLLDENGNEYVQVCILKDKIKELRKLVTIAAPMIEYLASDIISGEITSERDYVRGGARAWLKLAGNETK